MVDTAKFRVSLEDDMTKRALAAQASIKSLEGQLRSLNKAAAMARGPEALKRFNLNEDLKSARGRERLIKQQATMQAAAQAKAQAKALRAEETHQKKVAAFRQFKADTSLGSTLASAGSGLAIGATVGGLALVAAGAVAAAHAVMSIGSAFASASVAGLAFAQDSKLAIGALIGDSAMAAKQFDEVRLEAIRLGQDAHGAVDGFRKLLSAQFDIPMARELVRMSADLSVAGANVEKALLAISQIKMKGFLQGEELTGQLAEAGVSAELVYQQLEKRLGKTRKEIMKMQRTGQIKADVAIEAILGAAKKKTGVDEFGQLAAQRAEQTLSGMSGRFGAQVQNMFIDIGQKLEPVLMPIARKVFELFDQLTSDPKVQGFGQFLLEKFKEFATWVDENWPAIKETVVGVVHGIIDGFYRLIDVGLFLQGHWETIRAVGIGLAVVLGVIALGTFLLLLPMYLAVAAIVAVVAALAFAIGWLVENVPKWFEAGKAIVQGLIDGIVSKFEDLKAVAQRMAAFVQNPFTAAMAIQSPSKVFEQYGVYTVEGFVKGVQANDNAVSGVTADMAGAAVRGIDSGEADVAESGEAVGGSGLPPIHIENLVVKADTEEGGRAGMRGVEAELRRIFEENAA